MERPVTDDFLKEREEHYLLRPRPLIIVIADTETEHVCGSYSTHTRAHTHIEIHQNKGEKKPFSI